MSNASNKPKSADQTRRKLEQRPRVIRVTRYPARGENSTKRDVHRGLSVLVHNGEKDLPVGNNSVHVKDVTGNVSFEKVERLAVSKSVEKRPELALFVDFLSHRELVAKIARSSVSHARDPKVLSQDRCGLLIKFIQRNDPIDNLVAR